MQISTKWTWFLKKALPWYWLLFASIFFAVAGYSHSYQGPAPEYFFLATFIFFAAIYLLFRRIFGGILDVVTMKEQHLILENHGQTIKVPFSEVERIELSRLINPPRVTLFFKKTNGFGKKAVFATYVRYGLTFEFPEVDELKKRVQASRKS